MRAFLRTKPSCWAALVPFAPFVAVELLQMDLAAHRLSWRETSAAQEVAVVLAVVLAAVAAVGFE